MVFSSKQTFFFVSNPKKTIFLSHTKIQTFFSFYFIKNSLFLPEIIWDKLFFYSVERNKQFFQKKTIPRPQVSTGRPLKVSVSPKVYHFHTKHTTLQQMSPVFICVNIFVINRQFEAKKSKKPSQLFSQLPASKLNLSAAAMECTRADPAAAASSNFSQSRGRGDPSDAIALSCW